MLSALEKEFGPTRLIGWQFAADGKWDEAARVFYGVASADVDGWLARQKTDNIAFEAMFVYADGRKFFIGFRITDVPFEGKSRIIKELLDTSAEGMALSDVLRLVRTALGDEKLMSSMPDYLELGVFDIWNRVGSVVVWGGHSLMKPEEIVGPQPDAGFAPLHEPQPNPLMLEGAWKKREGGYQCWIGLPVSDAVDGRAHVLSPEKYSATAAILVSNG